MSLQHVGEFSVITDYDEENTDEQNDVNINTVIQKLSANESQDDLLHKRLAHIGSNRIDKTSELIETVKRATGCPYHDYLRNKTDCPDFGQDPTKGLSSSRKGSRRLYAFTPQTNGLAEIMSKILKNSARTMMNAANVHDKF